MRVEVETFNNGIKVYRKKHLSTNTIINIYCFLSGLVIGFIIAVPFIYGGK